MITFSSLMREMLIKLQRDQDIYLGYDLLELLSNVRNVPVLTLEAVTD